MDLDSVELVQQLSYQDHLVTHLQAAKTDTTHLAMPENLDWEDIEHFLIGGTRNRHYPELDLDEYLLQPGAKAAQLTTERVEVQASIGQVRRKRGDR